MGKSSGGADTSGLEKATREATALQRQMYEQGREDFQPWYQAGAGSINKLADLLGVTGGSVQSRDDIYSDLLPQYTTQQTIQSPQSDMFINKRGELRAFADLAPHEQKRLKQQGAFTRKIGGNFNRQRDIWKPYQTSQSQDVINYDALNAAVEEQLAAQSETPEDYGSLLQKFGMDKFEADPGYEFRQREANKALERQMAAQGVTLGGAGFGDINPSAARNLSELNQNLASQEYSNAYNRYTQDQLNTFNMLMGASGQGAGVTGQQVAAGNQYSTNVGNLQTGLASAQLNAQMAQDAQSSGMFNSLLGTAGQLGSAYLMASDIRVKKDIVEAGEQNGHKLYEFSYKNDDTRYRGVMAQDVQLTHPDAVKDIDGILHVDYGQLGLQMEVV